MANFLESLWNGAKDSIESPMRVLEGVVKGDFGDAWEKLKAIPGNQEDINSDIFNSVGIGGWVGDHPGETVAAAAAAVLGGTAAMGAMGTGAAGTTGSAASTLGGTAQAGGAASNSFLQSLSNMGSTVGESVSGMWNSQANPLANAWDAASAPSDDLLAALAEAESGGAVEAAQANSPEWQKAWEGVKNAPNAMEKIADAMGSVPKSGQQSQQLQHSGPRGGGSSNIQTEDQYSAAMQALVDKYGHLMFNQNF